MRNKDHRYYHTKDETVWFMISTVPSGEPGVKNRYFVYSGYSQIDLAAGRGKQEHDFIQLRYAIRYVDNQIKMLER